MTPEPWTPGFQSWAYMSDHDATQNSPETYSFTSQLAKHDGLAWPLIQVLVNSRACDVIFASNSRVNMGRHHVFVKRNILPDVSIINSTQMDHSRRSWYGKPRGASLREADLANTEAPAQSSDSTISSSLRKVQAPPERRF